MTTGKLIAPNLQHERITEDDLTEEMRLSQVASAEDVSGAILETSAHISFIPKRS